MEAKVVKVGTSLGLVIPRFIAVEGGFTHGTPINIEYKDGQMVVSRKKKIREGWSEAFAKYASEGEDEMMIPDFMDSEVEELM
jgi:antitoxin component of MazEF toxin-antitoxin module